MLTGVEYWPVTVTKGKPKEGQMNSQLSLWRAQATQRERSGEVARSRGERGPILWTGLTVRLATGADRPALERLAELDETTRPAEPVLLGEVRQRPVAALSLADGKVVADPFSPTHELVELLRLRAQQMGAHEPGRGRRHAIRRRLTRIARARAAQSAG
jgi:hypothetical protein